jgi:rare lipoprotein A
MTGDPRAQPGRRARLTLALTSALLVAVLAGCAATPPAGPVATPPPPSAPPPGRDGPPDRVPPDLAQVPDAEPRLETIRSGGPNRPYVLFGRFYQPLHAEAPLRSSGLASWYGRAFHGRPTASGEPYDMFAMTAAHTTLPIPSYVRVRNPANGREVIVRVNDRGPFHPDRIIDLSYTAALKLDVLRGVRPVEIERITPEDIRTGAWRRNADTAIAQAPRPTAPPVVAPAPAAAAATAQPVVGPSEVTVAAIPSAAGPGDPAEGEPVAPTATPESAGSAGFWVQLGAFRDVEAARGLLERMAAELADALPRLTLVSDERLHRVQAGPYRSRREAQGAADRLRPRLATPALVVQRR